MENPTDQQVEQMLMEALEAYAEENEPETPIHLSTFEEAGVLTNNKGVVLAYGNKKFHLTIAS